jgi:hypothetical protein
LEKFGEGGGEDRGEDESEAGGDHDDEDITTVEVVTQWTGGNLLNKIVVLKVLKIG